MVLINYIDSDLSSLRTTKLIGNYGQMCVVIVTYQVPYFYTASLLLLISTGPTSPVDYFLKLGGKNKSQAPR